MRQYIDATNSAASAESGKPTEHRLEISDGTTTTVFTDDFTANSLTRAPKVGTAVDYTYRSSVGPIRSVWFQLTDGFSSVKVTGPQPSQVDGLVALTVSDIDPHCGIGGPGVRFLGYVSALVVVLLLEYSGLLSFPRRRPGESWWWLWSSW
jgi:hypothetical protein